MALSVVRTGNVALDRFLDEVRRKIDTLESTTKTVRVGGSGGTGGGNSLTAAETAHIEKMAREITDSRLAQELRKPIDTKRVQGAVDELRSEVRARIDQVKADLLGGFQAGIDATVIQEINDRTAAVEAEAIARADAIAAEAHTRLLQVQEVANSALDALTAVHQETTDRQAAVALARSDLQTYTDAAVSAEATQRTILAAQILGADGTSNTTGLIYDERTARVAQDNALATQITLLSAGAGEQFDWKKIWYFDSGIESWTGNGTPTASGGWLRPANAGSNAYVESPTGMASDGSQYGQVRLRIRKAGSPTFAGYVWWRTAADSTWDASRRVALTAPTYDANGIGLITVSPNWTGVIDRIRVDLSSAQDGTNYFEIDWVAVGRPSPGASSAQLLEEQTARAAADAAEVTARQTLSSKLTGLTDPSAATLASLTSGLMYDERTARTTADLAQVTSINNLQASLTTLDGEVTTLTSSVTTIETAVAELETTAASTTTEVISLGRTFDQGMDQSAEALLRDIIATDNERKTRINEVALARTQLSTQIVEGLSAEAAARTILEARVGTAETAITTEQTARATADTALTESITLLTADLGDANAAILAEQTARASADSALSSDITTLEATVVANNTTVNAAIASEATARASADTAIASDLTALTTRVGTAEADIISEATARASADSAQVTSINALTTRMGTAEADILTEQTARASGDSANASLITTLTSRVDTAEADIAAVEITAGTAATKAGDLEGKYTVKVTAGGHVAGFGLASTSNAAGVGTSSFIVQADKFGIVSTDGTTSKVPFSVNTTTGKVVFQSDVSIDGNLLVTGTVTNDGLAGGITHGKIASVDAAKITVGQVTASQIDSRGLSIKDADGNIILAAGTALDYTRVGGTKPPSDADKTSLNTAAGITGQGAFATLSQITTGNASTYIANAAIGSAQVGTLTADNIDAGAITSSKIGTNTLSAVTIDTSGSVRATGSYSEGSFSFLSANFKTGGVFQTTGSGLGYYNNWLAGAIGYVPSGTENAYGKFGLVGLHNVSGNTASLQGSVDYSGGVVGVTDTGTGVYGYASGNGNGLVGHAVGGSGYSLKLLGSGRVMWGGLTITTPPNTTTTFLRGDGQWVAPPATTSIAWAGVTGRPTTLSGYGITDAAGSSHNHDGAYAAVGHNHSGTYQTADGTIIKLVADPGGGTSITGYLGLQRTDGVGGTVRVAVYG